MRSWLPYCGAGPTPDGWLARWNLAPELLASFIAIAIAIYLYRRSLRTRPALAALFCFGFLFISPFCTLGSALFTVRIIHDVILVAVLAPFLVAALRLDRTSIRGTLVFWTAVHVLTFWLWHAPPLYEAAMSSDVAFWLMQASLVAAAAIWCAKAIQSPAPAAAASLLATMVAMGTLGALLTFSSQPFYAPHWATTQVWGLSPIEDQQIAGIIMWAPASLIYLAAALTVIYRAIGTKAPA